MIVAGAAWIPFLDDKLAEVAQVAVHPDYSFRQHTRHIGLWKEASSYKRSLSCRFKSKIYITTEEIQTY